MTKHAPEPEFLYEEQVTGTREGQFRTGLKCTLANPEDFGFSNLKGYAVISQKWVREKETEHRSNSFWFSWSVSGNFDGRGPNTMEMGPGGSQRVEVNTQGETYQRSGVADTAQDAAQAIERAMRELIAKRPDYFMDELQADLERKYQLLDEFLMEKTKSE